jgi:hypothetical protein
MGSITLFPGTVEISAVPEPEIDLDARVDQQADLLVRWRTFGEEVRRLTEQPLPFALALELRELLDQPDP